MNAKISVVIPVYNIEEYLQECIDSVLNQTYKNLEIILVDDGSTDQSGILCEQAAQHDSRIKVIHKKNGGLSSARNAGLKAASGEYLTYIDSDDYVTETYVEYLYGLIQKYHTEMSVCTHTVVFENGYEEKKGDGTDELLDDKTCLYHMLYMGKVDTSGWAKMFTIDLARKFPFPEGKLFEDTGNVYRYILESKKIACGYKAQYYYRIRQNSIVTGAFNERKFDLLEMTDMMAADVKRRFPELKDAVLHKQLNARFSTLNQMQDVHTHKQQKQEIIAYIRKHGGRLLKDRAADKSIKIAYILLKISYPLYRYCWKLFLGAKKNVMPKLSGRHRQ